MYYSIPPFEDNPVNEGWAVGIAASNDLCHWEKVGEVLPSQACDAKGLAAPVAIVLDGVVHLFYQTYGNGPDDALCHAVSRDGLTFEADPSNPVFAPTGDWTVGRAIDADIIEHNGQLLLYYATRDPQMKVQMLGVAIADRNSALDRGSWHHFSKHGPILWPQLPWETNCIEAPSVCKRNGKLWMFYAGGYNNEPQQIGCAVSTDGMTWARLSDQPLLPNGSEGEWNSSESGHPGVFVDEDGQTYLFFQGNNDNGHTWLLSFVKLDWDCGYPRISNTH
jgi:beta-xylosidase